MECLEIGCGSGDVAFDLAGMVGPTGRVVATDLDEIKLKLAIQEAEQQRVTNVEFRLADVVNDELQKFHLAHARFVLSHLPNPLKSLEKIWQALLPGGVLAVQDTDFRGHFCHPEFPAFSRYVELYMKTAERRGADSNIGPRLPELLVKAGFEAVQMKVVQVAEMSGESKLMAPITMENIADSVLAEGLATRTEIEQLVHELEEVACDAGTVISGPRVIQTWGYRPPALT
jgi:ubiquinone/menaquinone biosynthesis C-methylase UbiE